MIIIIIIIIKKKTVTTRRFVCFLIHCIAEYAYGVIIYYG